MPIECEKDNPLNPPYQGDFSSGNRKFVYNTPPPFSFRLFRETSCNTLGEMLGDFFPCNPPYQGASCN